MYFAETDLPVPFHKKDYQGKSHELKIPLYLATAARVKKKSRSGPLIWLKRFIMVAHVLSVYLAQHITMDIQFVAICSTYYNKVKSEQ
jgi:hypothetical protein